MHALDQAFGAFLLEAEVISPAELSHAETEAKKSSRTLGEVLVSQGVLSDEDFSRAKAHVSGVPYVDLSSVYVPLEVLSFIPEPVSRRIGAIAYKREDTTVHVAVLDLAAKSDLRFLEERGYRVRLALASQASIKRALVAYQRLLSARFGSAIKSEASKLDALFEHARLARATRMHIDPTESGLRVRYRINGRLHDALALPLSAAKEVLVGGRRTVYEVQQKDLTKGGSTLESLGLRGQALEDTYAAVQRGSGLILGANPARLGTKGLLDALLCAAEHPADSVVSIEGANDLRRALGEDRDIIVISDLADAETAVLALSAAVRGKLVLAGIGAQDAVSGIERLRAFGADPRMVSSAVSASIGSRFVPKMDAGEQYFLSEKDIRTLSKLVPVERLAMLLREEGIIGPNVGLEGVPFMNHAAGYKGGRSDDELIGLYEVLSVTPRLRDLIGANERESILRKEAELIGMVRMIEDGLVKAALGLSSLEDALRIAPLLV